MGVIDTPNPADDVDWVALLQQAANHYRDHHYQPPPDPLIGVVADWQMPVLLAELEAKGREPTREALNQLTSDTLGGNWEIKTATEAYGAWRGD